MLLKGIGDVFEEDEAEDDVLVFRRIHVVAELVGGQPQLCLGAEMGGGVFGGTVGFRAGHSQKGAGASRAASFSEGGRSRAYMGVDLLHLRRFVDALATNPNPHLQPVNEASSS